VDGIVLVAPPGWEEPAILVAEEEGCGKVHACVTGGETRSDSVRAGLAEVPADALVVLVHDAARPLLSDEVVERVLAPLSEGWDGVVPGLPVGDTLKRVGPDGGVEETVSRDRLWAVQTPQAFAADRFRHALASNSLLQATDCAGMVEADGGRVKVVEGDPRLLKVTSEADLETVAGWR
jgi:2-C-methyl-D-erythritol 4-phosphate cytidylyltransferase